MTHTPHCETCNEPMQPTLDAPGEWACGNVDCPVCDVPVWIGGEIHPEDLGE